MSLRQQEGARVAWAEGQPSELQSLVSLVLQEQGLQVNSAACGVALCMAVCWGVEIKLHMFVSP